MGGLLARRYILQQKAADQPHGLGKVITLASPFLGAPDATYKLYTGGDYAVFSLAVSPSSIKFLASHLLSIHQLLPSRIYHELRGGIIVERGDADGNGIADENYEYGRIVAQLNTAFPNTSPGQASTNFHDFAGQDDWRTDQSGIQYFHLLGVQKELNTNDGLYVTKSIRCRCRVTH